MTDKKIQYAIYPSLEGARVVVTGGATGIGASIVEAFVAQGAHVAFLDIDEAGAKTLIGRLGGLGPAPEFFPCDLTRIPVLESTMETVLARLGGVDVLVNNAASDDRHQIEEVDEAYWDGRMAVNLRHQFFASKAVIPLMKEARRGAIVNMGSVSWHLALPGMPAYLTAKAAIEGLTRAFARDLGPFGIRVNCVIPGAIRTERQMKLWSTPESEAQILSEQCLKFRIDPEHVARLVLFLASDDAMACTAHEYFVDAGWR